MWKTLKTILQIIAELPGEPSISARAMPQTHYLNDERGFMDELVLLLPAELEQPRREVVENEADTLAV